MTLLLMMMSVTKASSMAKDTAKETCQTMAGNCVPHAAAAAAAAAATATTTI